MGAEPNEVEGISSIPPNGSLSQLAQRMPCVADRALLELVNGMLVSRAMLQAGSGERGLGLLLRRAMGSDRRQLLAVREMLGVQEVTVEWITELTAQVAVTHLAIARVAECLATQQTRARQHEEGLRLLAAGISDVFEACNERIAEIDKWRRETDVRLAAQESIDAIGYTLDSPQYRDIPWPYQVLFLSRSLASEHVGEWERIQAKRDQSERDRFQLRSRVVTEVVRSLDDVRVPPGGLTLSRILDESCAAIDAEDDRSIMAELLDAGLQEKLSLPSGPYNAMAASAMELASLPSGGRPSAPGATALALARKRFGWIDGSYGLAELVKVIVDEQFEAAAIVWQEATPL